LGYNGARSVGRGSEGRIQDGADIYDSVTGTVGPTENRTAMSGSDYETAISSRRTAVKKRNATPVEDGSTSVAPRAPENRYEDGARRQNERGRNRDTGRKKLSFSRSPSVNQERRRQSSRGRWRDSDRHSRSRIRSQEPDDESSDTDSDEHVRTGRPKHILKPPKYDGSTPFETFWAQFKNCAGYNRWTRHEELAYLRSALEKEAGQVLWDYGTEVTNSLQELTGILKDRFGGAHMADKYRIVSQESETETWRTASESPFGHTADDRLSFT